MRYEEREPLSPATRPAHGCQRDRAAWPTSDHGYSLSRPESIRSQTTAAPAPIPIKTSTWSSSTSTRPRLAAQRGPGAPPRTTTTGWRSAGVGRGSAEGRSGGRKAEKGKGALESGRADLGTGRDPPLRGPAKGQSEEESDPRVGGERKRT